MNQMRCIKAVLLGLISVFFMAGCTDGPGELKGTWKSVSGVPMTIVYRDDEEESLGMISKVSYEHEGNDVLVTYESGLAKGTTVRITLTGPRSAVTAFGRLRKID